MAGLADAGAEPLVASIRSFDQALRHGKFHATDLVVIHWAVISHAAATQTMALAKQAGLPCCMDRSLKPETILRSLTNGRTP